MLVMDGADIRSEEDFHNLLAGHPKVPGFYGRNLDALWDAITGLIERPFEIVWFNADESKSAMGERFDLIVQTLRKAEAEDASMDWPASRKFRFHLLTGPLEIPSETNP